MAAEEEAEPGTYDHNVPEPVLEAGPDAAYLDCLLIVYLYTRAASSSQAGQGVPFPAVTAVVAEVAVVAIVAVVAVVAVVAEV